MFHTLPGLVVWLATPALNKLNPSHSHVPIIKIVTTVWTIVTIVWTRQKFSISGWSNLITACQVVTLRTGGSPTGLRWTDCRPGVRHLQMCTHTSAVGELMDSVGTDQAWCWCRGQCHTPG